MTAHTPTPAQEALLRAGRLNDTSLQVCIDSPNFRDYEKSMARELLERRRSQSKLVEALQDAMVFVRANHDGSRSHQQRLNAMEAALAALPADGGGEL